MAPDESSDATPVDPVHLSDEVHIHFVRQGETLWATMLMGDCVIELGPLNDGDVYAEGILRIAADVLVEHPRWADEIHISTDRSSRMVRIGQWVLTARGPTSHARFATEADAEEAFVRACQWNS